ncbi:hypothetical protein MSG28_011320 [Choristoneura fumiferana]|uniref:Uncharacterized protein n=1 Tax=Choristoneura fumiferana TaxID=7141 RepID=A0ACC0KR54_CHOFU|nr:hypothetical protein MSG28_011320 [Choristoneura fumiferana]
MNQMEPALSARHSGALRSPLIPPPLVLVGAAGARLACAAGGRPPPALSWLRDGRPLAEDQHRRVHSNGTLEIAAAAAAAGAGELRCRAANQHGVALSAPVTLLPVADDGWEAEVTAEPAAAGGVAALACGPAGGVGAGGAGGAPPTGDDDGGELEAALWYHGDRVIDVPPPSPEARYLAAGNVLLIRGVSPQDAGEYGCLARHRDTRRTRRARPARLLVLDGAASSAPVLSTVALTVRAAAGAPGEGEGEAAWRWAGGAALCVRRALRAAAGGWLCRAASARGDRTARLRLRLDEPLAVSLQPELVVGRSGSTVRFNCSCSWGAALSWRHDGASLAAAAALRARLGAAGLLELRCEARRGRRAAQASAELRLAESAPELQYTFIEQALRPGGDATLRCVAAATPPPRITWLLDDKPLAHYRAPHR